ncbi:hypothetical protein [Antrihabitans spumae]|uniref:GDT1 family protein n=1 Tax=Antrihabitans spumae TaxID=3373370 RepID=A0ABW7KDR0_9NOCA
MSVLLAAATDPATVVLAEGIFTKANGLVDSGTDLLRSAAGALAIFFLLKNLIASFTVVRLVTSALIGGALLWVVFNMNTISDSTGEELAATHAAPAVVLTVAALPGPLL